MGNLDATLSKVVKKSFHKMTKKTEKMQKLRNDTFYTGPSYTVPKGFDLLRDFMTASFTSLFLRL